MGRRAPGVEKLNSKLKESEESRETEETENKEEEEKPIIKAPLLILTFDETINAYDIAKLTFAEKDNKLCANGTFDLKKDGTLTDDESDLYDKYKVPFKPDPQLTLLCRAVAEYYGEYLGGFEPGQITGIEEEVITLLTLGNFPPDVEHGDWYKVEVVKSAADGSENKLLDVSGMNMGSVVAIPAQDTKMYLSAFSKSYNFAQV